MGTTEPRKNLANIIAAWETVRTEFDFVIAGSTGWDEFTVQPGMEWGTCQMNDSPPCTEPPVALVYQPVSKALACQSWSLFSLLPGYYFCKRRPWLKLPVSLPLLVDPNDPEAIAEAAGD